MAERQRSGLFLGFELVIHPQKKVAYRAPAGLRGSHLHMLFRSAPLSLALGDVTDGKQGRLAEPQHLAKWFHIRKESEISFMRVGYTPLLDPHSPCFRNNYL